MTTNKLNEKCNKCKGRKVRTRTKGMVCLDCKPPRTGRIEKKGDREKLERVLQNLTYIPINPVTTKMVYKTIKVSPICFVDIDSEGYPIGVEIIK